MAELEHFNYGWITSAVGYLVSTVGCLLAFLLAMKARQETGRQRRRLLIYASVAFGATGIWLMHVIAMLGLTAGGMLLRYDPAILAAGLAVAVVDIGTGLFIAGFGRRSWWRLTIAGLVIALGTTATQFITLAGIHLNGRTVYDRTWFTITVGLAVVVAVGALWSTTGIRRLPVTVAASFGIAGALTAMHLAGVTAIRVQPGVATGNEMQRIVGVGGVSAVALLGPLLVIGTLLVVMLAYFSIGNSTRHELHAIFDPNMGEIEPELLKEISARIAVGVAASATPAFTFEDEPTVHLVEVVPMLELQRPALQPRRAPRPRPTPGTIPSWRSMPVWGAPEPTTEIAAQAVGRSSGRGGRHTPNPVPVLSSRPSSDAGVAGDQAPSTPDPVETPVSPAVSFTPAPVARPVTLRSGLPVRTPGSTYLTGGAVATLPDAEIEDPLPTRYPPTFATGRNEAPEVSSPGKTDSKQSRWRNRRHR